MTLAIVAVCDGGTDHNKQMALPDQLTVDYPSFNLLVVGDANIGKTTFVGRHRSALNSLTYLPTMGALISPLDFTTNCGKIRFNCCDTIGQERCGFLQNSYYAKGQCAIIMFDVTARWTYQHVPRWYEELYEVCGDIPIVLCGNKVDMKKRKVKVKHITFHRKKSLQYYEISASSNYNVEKPFLYLARKLLGNPKLYFVEAPVLYNPSTRVNLVAEGQNEAELAQLDRNRETHLDYEVDLHTRKHAFLCVICSCFGDFHVYKNKVKLAQAACQPHPAYEVDLHTMCNCFGNLHVYKNEAKSTGAVCELDPDYEVDLHEPKFTLV